MARSKYHLIAKGGKRKQFNKNGASNSTNATWLKTRHRVRKKLWKT